MSTTIRVGYIGMETQNLRAALANYGFHPNYTVMDPNLFDAWVDAAVKAFQLSVHLPNDGIVGPNTWAALYGQSTQPATQVAPPAAANQPDTSPVPGKFPTTLAPSSSPPESNTPMILGGIAVVLGFIWWRNRKGGTTLAGLPFGAGDDERAEAKREREHRRRKSAARIERITEAFEIEVKRTGIDPERAPGHALALRNRVARAVDKEEEVLERATPGRKLKSKPGLPTYREERTKVGRKLFPGNTSPSTGLRNRDEGEDEAWLERVESARGAAQGTKRIQVSARRYHTDKAYRESEQADARRIADEGGREVQLVNERGTPLFRYQPNARNFKDAASEQLIEAVADDAKKGNCPKAVKNLFRVRPLALDKTTERLLDSAAAAVAKNCADTLNSDLEMREEAREEAGGEAPHRATLREVRDVVGLVRSRRTKASAFTPKAIAREIEKGNISEEDGEALMQMARDEARGAKNAEMMVFVEPKTRGTARHTRKRRGELDAQVTVSPGGRTRTLRVKA